MKKITTTLLLVLGMTTGFSQESADTGYTGDNFSLEGALDVFKKSNSLEEFEQRINEQDNNVNNLDLNHDGETDYIVVEDIQENDTHIVVLSTYLNENEKQDIATINIQKTGTEEAVLDIVGDENLYASNTIVEPYEASNAYDNTNYNTSISGGNTTRIVVNVWLWPSIRYIYAPRYVVWVSPHRWAHYPGWWRPWRVYHYRVFYSKCAPHRVYYHRTPTRRVVITSNIYSPRRHTSTLVVKNRHSTTVIHKNNRGSENAARTNTSPRDARTTEARNNRAQTSSTRSNRANEKATRANTPERHATTSNVKNNRVQTKSAKSNREDTKDRGNRKR